MAQLRGSEMVFGRHDGAADYVDTTATPIVTRYANHGSTAPSPYGGPPLPPYDSIAQTPPAPRHFLPPYDYENEPAPSMPPAGGRSAIPPNDFAPAASMAPRGGGHEIPPNDFADNVATRPPPSRRDPLPPYDAPLNMVIPGVQHPNGRFEPHPNFTRRSAPLGPSMEPELPVQARRSAPLGPSMESELPIHARRSAPLGPSMEPELPVPARRSAPLGPPMEPELAVREDPRFARRSVPLGPAMGPELQGPEEPYYASRSAPFGPPMEPELPVRAAERGPVPEKKAVPIKKTVEVAVPVCCEECKERIINYVGGTPGVDAVECDVFDQKVKVTGDLTPGAVLQRCQKCFRKSTLIG